MGNKPKASKIPNAEWDFSCVLDQELEICVIYEYARECVSFMGYQLGQEIKPKFVSSDEDVVVESDERVRIFKDILSSIEQKGFDRERFLGNYYNSDCGYAELYDYLRDNIKPFSPSWINLPEQVRSDLNVMAKERNEFFPPLKIAYVESLEKLWIESSRDLIAARALHKGTKLENDDDSELFVETRPLMLEAQHLGELHGETIAAFTIDFRRHNNATILRAFAAWLEEHRPLDCPQPTLVGKKYTDLRFNLKCLGVMRLLHCYTFDEIAREYPEILQSTQFKGNKWLDANKWYSARRRVLKTYHEVFPFLDKNEKPINYETAGSHGGKC